MPPRSSGSTPTTPAATSSRSSGARARRRRRPGLRGQLRRGPPWRLPPRTALAGHLGRGRQHRRRDVRRFGRRQPRVRSRRSRATTTVSPPRRPSCCRRSPLVVPQESGLGRAAPHSGHSGHQSRCSAPSTGPPATSQALGAVNDGATSARIETAGDRRIRAGLARLRDAGVPGVGPRWPNEGRSCG